MHLLMNFTELKIKLSYLILTTAKTIVFILFYSSVAGVYAPILWQLSAIHSEWEKHYTRGMQATLRRLRCH